MNRNEKRRWSRILAMILVFAMVFCDPSMSYAAEVVGEMLTAEAPATENVTEEDQAAAEAEAAQAAAESEAARLAAESEAAAKAAAESEAAAKAAAESEAAAKAGTLVLKTEPVSTQNKGEAAKLKVTYSLSADSGMESVETRLYVPGQTISYPQFTANGETRFVDPVTGRVFDLKRDENWNLYIEYTLHRGETFEEEFQFVDPSVTAGSQNTFEVSITTRGTIPANSSVQTTTARVTYAVWAEETEAPVETETAAETETETETETVSEAESETETETAVETESETETETAAATESETETETESETEIVTETETAQVETENAGIFDYEDDKAQISVEILNLTPENQGLRFAVNSIGEESKTFEKIAEQIMEGGSTALVDMLAYYIGVVDETGKAPAENELIYQITMKFKTPVLSISDYLSEEDKDSTEGEVKVYVEGTEIPADIQKNKKGAITGISFITDKVGNTAVALTGGLQTTADITMKTESNEYFMKLEDAKQTNLKVDMSVVKGEAVNDVQNAKPSAKLTYYDADGNEVEGITPAELQGFGVRQGSYLGNSLNNINGSDREKVVYVKISMEAGELADTSFEFGEDDPSYDQGSRTLTFKLAKRTFELDEEITTKKGITYIAVGPNHQYGLTGPLGLVSNFHAVGFSKVTTGVHTNGNILTKKLNYENNFGTKGLTGEISYIRSFESIAAGMMCGDGIDDILVLGKDIDVTWAGNTFYLNGQKLTTPRTIYQDTEEYQYLDIDAAKEEAESLSSQFGALPDAGVTFENKTFKVSNGYSGMTVINVGHGMLGTEALAIEGLHNQSGTSLLINVRVPKGTEEITIPNVSINGTSSGSGEVIDFSAGKVIWNVVYEDGTLYTGKVSNGGAVAGTILVPDGKVHAAHNWNGSLIADEIEITGETHRTDFTGVLGFGVSKVLKGRDWKLSDRFQFELSAKEGTPMPIGSKTREGVQKKIISVTYSNRSPSFGGITYGTADIGKTYQYTLKELEGNIKDIIYSEAVYTIQVSIQSNNGQGLLIIKKYSKNGGKTWEDKMPEEDVFEFTNVSGVEFKVKKKYNSTYPGKDDDNVFKFVLKGLNGAPMPEKDENAPEEPNDQKTIIVTSSEEVSFDSITYKEDGTYKYEISEVKGKINGVTYDEKVYDVKVEVSKDENGTKVIKVRSREKGAEDAEYKLLEKGTVFTAEFTNTYDDASAEIQVQKNYNGTYPEGDNAFKFILKALNGAPLPKIEEEEPSEAAVQSTQDTQREVVVTNGEPVSFGTIEYSTKGTYYYEVSEVTESLPGVTYDRAVYEVKVEVTENEDKTKTVKVSYRKQSKEGEPERDYQALESGTVFMAEFINTYKAEPVETTVSGTKTLTGQTLKEDQFDFELRLVEKDNAAVSGDAQTVVTAKNKADGSISFGTLKYTEAGTYVYEAKETSEPGNGISVDTSIFTVTVKVKDNGLGQLVIESKTVTKKRASADLKFENTYKTGEAEAEVKATKKLTGRDLKADEFEFSLTPVSAVAEDGTAITDPNAAQTAKNTKGGDVVFGGLKYTKAGTYTYEMKETSVNGNGVTVDSTIYTVTVTVVDNGKGILTATPAYSIDKKTVEPEFENIYKPAKTTAAFTAEKKVEGPTIADDTFTFELYKDKVEGTPLDTQTITGKGTVDFVEQTYEEAGTYTYKIVEKAGTTPGYTYDASVYTVIVEVTDIGGELVRRIIYVKDGTSDATTDAGAAEAEESGLEAAIFTNTYKPAKTTAVFTAEKKVEGPTIADDTFTFELYKDKVEGTALDTKTITGNGTVDFAEQTYEEAGTYTYKIVEKAGTTPGYTYDASIYTVIVEVTDIGGKLESKVTYVKDLEKAAEGEEVMPSENALFTNTYKPAKTTAVFAAEKKVEGLTPADSTFTFELYKNSVEAANLLDTQNITGAGITAFAEQTYDAAGIYTYKIVEKAGEEAGYTYDTSVYTVTVEVTDIGGKLESKVTYAKDGADNAAGEVLAAAVFTNTYNAGDTKAVFTAKKTIKGDPQKTSRFTFELYKDSILEANLLDTKSIRGEGTVDFTEQTYDVPGTYTYKIVEKAGETAGYSYDGSIYTVTVEVTDIGGKLTNTVTYAKDDAAAGAAAPTAAEFINTYDAGKTNAVLTATKTIKGTPAKDSKFTFELYKDSVAEENLLDTKSITGTGSVNFKEQNYKAVGTYTYKIVEKAGKEAGYTYDTSVYTATVVVTDKGGEMARKITYAKDGAEESKAPASAVFENTYDAGSTEAVFEVTKAVNGTPKKAGTFTFELYKDSVKESNLLDTQTIKGQGRAEFAAQTYKEPGTYTYKIIEKAGNEEGYTYDNSVYTVTVTVTDEGGRLDNTVAYENENGARRVYQAAEFVNEYKEKLGRIVVTKQVVNQTLDGEVPYLVTDTFYFALFKDEALTEMSDYGIKTLKLKNQSEGKVVFEDVDFGEYYLAETDKDGNPVTAPPFIEYFVTIEDPLCEVTKAESTVKKIVKNAKLPDNYGDFGDGEMTIDKYVLNGSEEYTVTDTFYFTLFRDEELKIPYEQFETKKLDLNDEAHGTVTFEKLPYGVYYLAETDADGKPVGDGFDYEVKIEKKQFTISETNKKETIRIDNCITPDTPGGKHTPKTPGGGDKPKTGDDTLIWPYVTMMLAALVAGTGSIFGKRRRKRSSK